MLNKLNIRHRTLSTLNTITKDQTCEIGIRVIEARLTINVAKIGSMTPFAKILFGKEERKTDAFALGGKNPKWNAYFLFTLTSSTIEIIVCDKTFIIGETEVGRCTIYLDDVLQGHNTEWWSLISNKEQDAGAVLISFDFYGHDNFSHSSNGSWDIKNYYIESPVVPKVKKVQSSQLSQMTPDSKILQFRAEPNEFHELEQLKHNLNEENERLKNQENKVRAIFDKLKNESNKLKIEKIDVRKYTECLKSKEESILFQRAKLETEKNEILQGKKEIKEMRDKLNLSFSKLKQEKLKIRAHRKLLDKNKNKLNETSKQLDKIKTRIEGLVNKN